ncbi:hypothetical protein [Desulfoferrobacter suflitae]|uniref:hypothetical protein n=1 Tax=Desulfoferrobacter suflitae TaxID=2865782 RepID=UPI002164A0AC|nr:hypothetical protein [Desulfoferrobacter suflitae]MCK8603871.1 hypothetical protein [Desulfoferrobacter suflitae]
MSSNESTARKSNRRVALAPFIETCPSVLTLGIRPCLDDYSEYERRLMREATRIFFPTPKYVDVFRACRIRTFPNPVTYRYQRSRILQLLLLDYAHVPHPRSRVYYGKRQKAKILEDFRLPVVVVQTRIGRTPEIIARHTHELAKLAGLQHAVIIREHIAWEKRIQLVCVQFECLGILRYPVGGRSQKPLEPVALDDPAFRQPVHLSKRLLRAAQLDDILIEWGEANGRWMVIGMGRPPAAWPTCSGKSNRFHYICDMIRTGFL